MNPSMWNPSASGVITKPLIARKTGSIACGSLELTSAVNSKVDSLTTHHRACSDINPMTGVDVLYPKENVRSLDRRMAGR